MATPVGHALAGLTVYAFVAKPKSRELVELALLCVLMAVAPDLDLVPGLIAGKPALYHSGVSHSLGVAVLVSLGIGAVYKMRGKSFFLVSSLCFFSYSSHLLMDFLGPDTRPPIGIPIFWPITGEHFISPFTVFLGMHHAANTGSSIAQWLQGIFSVYNLGAIALEIALIGPLLMVGRWLRRENPQAKRDVRK